MTSKSASSVTLDGGNITLVTDEFSIKVKGKDDLVLANLSSLAAHNSIGNLYADNVTAAKVGDDFAIFIHCIFSIMLAGRFAVIPI